MVELGALVLDAALGWPARLHERVGHPVGGFARVIVSCERLLNRLGLSYSQRRLGGVITLALLLILACGAGWLVQYGLIRTFGAWAWIGIAVAAWPALAQRSLYQHVAPILRALESKDLEAARGAVARIVGRDTEILDEAGVTRAAIESLAESFCDGVAAPLFWLVVAGLPGIWAYKAVNTADSLIGHREEPFGPFGWASARCDDLMNIIPARLSGILFSLAGGGGWRIMWRDHARHASPNGGWPEAAMAGVLGVKLAGPVRYDGAWHDKPWIGEEGREAFPADLQRALNIYVRACGLLWIFAALAMGVRS